MILPPNELRNFSYFTQNFENGYYEASDIVTLHYKLFKGFNYSKKFKFKRDKITENNKEFWRMSDDYFELVKQLDAIVKKEWHYVNKEAFKILLDNFPEYII